MGTLRGDNGGERPSDGGGLPDLPPEWGTIIIPDDAAELDHEAAIVRRQMRSTARRNRWRRRFGLAAVTGTKVDDDSPALGLPLLIMSIAIIATLTSLFAIAWPSKTAAPARAATSAPATVAATTPSAEPVLDALLTDSKGMPLHLRSLAPAVVLLVDGCPCAELLTQTSLAVPMAVTVLAVAQSPSAPPIPAPAPGHLLRSAKDVSGQLRAHYGDLPAPVVVALLVGRDGMLLRTVSAVHSVADLSGYLSELS